MIYVAFTEKGGGAFTLVNFVDFFRTDLFLRVVLEFALRLRDGGGAGASMLALPLAYITSRFTFRGTVLIQTLGFLPLIMPPFVGAVAMQLFFGRNGSVNLLLDDWFGFKIAFMDGLNGVIFVQSIHYFPFILINLSAALRNIDSLDGGSRAESRRQRLPAVPPHRVSAGDARLHRRRRRWCSSRCSTISPRRCC